MFHKTEEFLSKRTESEMDEMDTSDTQWGWFYLAECGKWHMFQRANMTESCMVSVHLSNSKFDLVDKEKGKRTSPY